MVPCHHESNVALASSQYFLIGMLSPKQLSAQRMLNIKVRNQCLRQHNSVKQSLPHVSVSLESDVVPLLSIELPSQLLLEYY